MRVLVTALVVAVVGLAVFVGAAASRSNDNVTVTVDTLPISNGLPLDLGIAKGFFNEQGITIKKVTFQSGNDIVLALANHNGDVGYLGYVPMMIARTSGIPLTLLSASEVEGTSTADNWQDILVKGNSPITTPAQLAGKTIAVNALKGVGEVVIKAALQKSGVDPNSIKLLALPFPTMRTALANGQVDAIWTPEPFITQATTIDGARIVMAPGPVLGNHFPNGGYAALHDWMTKNPDTAKKFAAAMNKSLEYAQSHPDEVRALLPASQQNIHLAVWTSTIDRPQLLQLAKYAKQYGVINSLPNFTQLFPSAIRSGQATGLLEGSINGSKIGMKTAGVVAKLLDPGKYLLVVTDKSKADNFRLKGPGINKATSVKGTGTQRWTLTLKPGTYSFKSDAHSKLHGSFRVS